MRTCTYVGLLSICLVAAPGLARDDQPTSSPLSSDSAGIASASVATSVMRVVCPGNGGTAFLHHSGWVVTAAHVVETCSTDSVRLLASNGDQFRASAVKRDDREDLAIIKPSPGISTARALKLNANETLTLGSQLAAWGYPDGYLSQPALLSVGYFAGVDVGRSKHGVSSPQFVVNAAFNSGNSGGPVILVEDGSVVGVVSSKLAPLPADVESSLEALASSKSILMYDRHHPDGTIEKVSEGRVVSDVLYHLRRQTQLVIGKAVTVKTLREFLLRNGVEP